MRKPIVLISSIAGLLLRASPAAAQPELPAFTQDQTRTVFSIGLVILGIIAAGWLVQLSTAGWAKRRWIAWRAAFRVVGWLPLVATVAMLVIGWLIGSSPNVPLPIFEHLRVIESIVPIAIGLQAAFLFSPDDEPGLEVVMACPRPLVWLVMERLGVLLLLQAIIALAGTGLTVQLTEIDTLTALLRWTAPSLFFAGIGIFITLRSRNALFGLMMTGCLWFVLVLFMEAFIPGQPIFYPLNYIQPFGWGIQPFMQPQFLSWQDYLLNRGVLAVFGLVLIGISVSELRNQEKMLLGTEQTRLKRASQSE